MFGHFTTLCMKGLKLCSSLKCILRYARCILAWAKIYQSQPAFACSKSAVETIEKSELCSKLTIKTPERFYSGVFIVNFEHTALVFPWLTLNKKYRLGYFFSLLDRLQNCLFREMFGYVLYSVSSLHFLEIFDKTKIGIRCRKW